MPAAHQYITHTFNGGWATDFGTMYYGAPNEAGILAMPFLVKARNCYYELDGGPHKIGGTSSFNASATGASDNITGLYDYWRMGTTAVPAQRIMVYSNGTLYSGGTDGVLTSLVAGLSGSAVPAFSTFDDILIFSNDSTGDVPRSYNQTTLAALAGSPPRFSFSVHHKNKLWASGVHSLPSRLYYSVDNDPEDWTGSGSGSIDIDPDDGDRIVGIISHQNDLWVFKGPYKGSIHRITGSSPTGSDAFARTTFIEGLTAVYHNAIFKFGNDIGFMSPNGTVHSLSTTDSYGDFQQAFLSLPIDSYVREQLNLARLKYTWAVNDPTRGWVAFSVPGSGSTNNSLILLMDYRFGINPPRWSYLDAFSFGSLAMIRDANSALFMYGGGYTGTVYKMHNATRAHVATAITFDVQTPSMTYGSEYITKTIAGVSLGLNPKNNNNVAFSHQVDNQAAQSQNIAQGNSGAVLDSFELDADVLGTATFLSRFAPTETGGDGRVFNFEVIDGVLNSDIEIHNIGAVLMPTGPSMEN